MNAGIFGCQLSGTDDASVPLLTSRISTRPSSRRTASCLSECFPASSAISKTARVDFAIPEVMAHAGSETTAARSIADPEHGVGVAASTSVISEAASSVAPPAASAVDDVDPPHVSQAPAPTLTSPIATASARRFEITPAS
jgi:hypothetical protein